MAWPSDARHKDFSALTAVPAATLNAIQDAVLGIYGGDAFFVNGFSALEAAAADPAWVFQGSLNTWVARAASSALTIPITFPFDVTITRIRVLYHVAAAVGMTLSPIIYTYNWGTPAAPGQTAIDTAETSSGGSPPDWRVADFPSLTQALLKNQSAAVVIANQDADDMVAGVLVSI